MKINEKFQDRYGVTYDSIGEVAFLDRDDYAKNFDKIGKYMYESDPIQSSNYWLGGSTAEKSGIRIYRSPDKKDIAYRIYNDWADYEYQPHFHARFLNELQKRQKNVTLTKFPTKVVTINGREIGQEIAFYENVNTLLSAIEKNGDREFINNCYIQIINIIDELLSNDIFYRDIHGKNFVVNKDSGVINLIDFEQDDVITKFSDYNYDFVIKRLNRFLMLLSEMKNFNYDTSMTDVDTIGKVRKKFLVK